MRRLLMVYMVLIGFVIQAVSYFLMAAPWGFPSTGEEFSNPRVPFSPLLFILGILVVFSGVLVYELFPDRENE